ncbi:MAG: hypothetical protein K9M75_07675, partial [Phycisphaerae bacterium]|nr:hypothetical protein [Phycisphaerae bacterium]
DTLVSTGGSTALFYFHDTRNDNNYNDSIDAMVEGATAEMMEGHSNGTMETPGLEDLITHIQLTDIPFAAYDLIFYIGTQQAQEGDGTGQYSLNGAPYADFARPIGRFDGTFDQVNDDSGDVTGNYILYEGVTGSSMTFKIHGTGSNHIGLSGFQIRENDPNAPIVSAGDNMITWEGEPVTLNATVDGTDSLWNMADVTYSWTASPADDPKLDVAVSNPGDLETTVTISKVPYLKSYLPNGSFEIVTVDGGQAVQSYRDYWGQYDRPAGATVSARQYVNNPAYHFPEGTIPDGDIMLRANSSTSESRADGVAILLGDAAYDPTATYELSVAVGRPLEVDPPNPNNYTDANWRGYLVQLVVGGQVESTGAGSDNIYGGTVVAEDANSIDIPRREWRTSVVTLDPSPGLADLAGEPIQIRLLTPDDADPAYATQTKVFYDDVKLLINGEAGIYIIDPGVPSVNMTFTAEEVSTGNTTSSSVSIDVYENPCEAAVAANPDMQFILGDITEDCTTDMLDLAILASEWLLDYTMQGAEHKLVD